MYILLTNDDSNYTFQKYDEAGTEIGDPEVFSTTTYRLDRAAMPTHLLVQYSTSPENSFPPVNAYPWERILYKTVAAP